MNPGAGLHIAFAQHGAGLHGGVHFVAGAVQEAGVDERHAAGRCGDTGFQVHAGAALFVHDAEFDGAVFEAQDLLNATKQFAGKCHFGGAMHFGFDDVDRACA